MATRTIELYNVTDDTWYGDTLAGQFGPNGAQEQFNCGGWGDIHRPYIRWDITGMPEASTVTTCKMFLFSQANTKGDPVAYINRITSSWDEETLTKTLNPTITTAGQVLITPNPYTSIQYWNWDVTQFYKDWRDGTYPNYGLHLRQTSNGENNGGFASKENVDSTRHPYLEITFDEGNQGFLGLM